LFLNDGLHAEHHASPRTHAFDLGRVAVDARTSRWPPVLRRLEWPAQVRGRALSSTAHAFVADARRRIRAW